MRGQIIGWLWRFTLPFLEERQYTMIIRTILDMMSTTDRELLAIMRTFEEEEAERCNCTIVERKEDSGGFLRWEGHLPEFRTDPGPAMNDQRVEDFGETKLPGLLRKDLSIFPRALRACQELGLAIWMTDITPRLRHHGLNVDFSISKISRPATWITQEVVRKLARNSFKSSILCSKGWREIENSPSSNHWLNWETSTYDDALLKFAIGARLYTLNTSGRN
jgi:hypothetical protein